MFELPMLAVAYCVLVAALFISLWLWYDRREYRRFERERRQRAFHCTRCETLYARPPGEETCPCPKCGHPNGPLRF
jgi:uncharacterized paraquat-inducible protein A